MPIQQTNIRPADTQAHAHRASLDAAATALRADINELLEEVRGVPGLAARIAKDAGAFSVAARAAEQFASAQLQAPEAERATVHVRRDPALGALAERVREMNAVVSILLADAGTYITNQEAK